MNRKPRIAVVLLLALAILLSAAGCSTSIALRTLVPAEVNVSGYKTIAVQSTTKPESIFLERTDSRIPLVREVYSLEDRELLYTSLGKGYVDAIAAHETAIRQYMKDYDVDYRILDESILATGIGVAFAKNDTRGLNEQLSRVFEEMRADGTTRTIIGRYLSDPDKYLEVDCAAD